MPENNNDDFIEAEKGYFVDRKQYFRLLNKGILPWEMRSYIQRSISSRPSSVGRPLKFQEKQDTV